MEATHEHRACSDTHWPVVVLSGPGCARLEALTWMARTLRARRTYRAHLRLAGDTRLDAVRRDVHRRLAAEWLARALVR